MEPTDAYGISGEPSRRLRDDLARVMRGVAPVGFVRDEILSSWHDSLASGLRPDGFAPRHDGATDRTSDVPRAVSTVTSRLAADLRATDVSVVVSDPDARVVAVHPPDDRQRAWLDAMCLAPGYSWRVDVVGTNALGFAAARLTATMVDGGEHFMDALTVISAASAPISDPRTGRALAAVSLVCPAGSTNSLLLPVVRRAAQEMEQGLLPGCSARERLLDEHFLRARRRTRAPLVVVGEATIVMNAAASRLVSRADQPRLWSLVTHEITRGDGSVAFVSEQGSLVSVTVEPVHDDAGDVIGALLQLRGAAEPGTVTNTALGGTSHRSRATFGWGSLTDSERTLAELVTAGLTNKEAATRLFVSHHTIDSHLRHIFRKLDVNSRVELARIVVTKEAEQGRDERVVA